MRSRSVGDSLPLLLAIVAEAGWIAVVAALVQEYAHAEPMLSLPALAGLVGAGTLAGRLLARRLGEAWPFVAVALVAAGALAGVLVADAARGAIAADGPAGVLAALGAHPGGLLGGLAVLRGIGYAGMRPAEDRLEQLLSGGTLAIVLCAIAGGFALDPWRASFIAEALLAGVAFAAAGVVALALRRQTREGGDVGADWTRNPRWLALLLVTVILICGLAALSSGLVRPALEILVGLAVLPVLVLGLVFGWTRRGAQLAAILALVALVVAVLFSLLGERGPFIEIALPDATGGQQAAPPIEPAVLSIGGGVLLALLGIAIFLLVRWWARRLERAPADPTELRFVDRRPLPRQRRTHRRWLGLGGAPRDAQAAYLALLARLEQREGVRREAWETAHEHAARLRRDHGAGLSLELLAADYTLSRFGGAALTAREERRAITRSAHLGRTLRPSEEPLSPD